MNDNKKYALEIIKRDTELATLCIERLGSCYTLEYKFR